MYTGRKGVAMRKIVIDGVIYAVGDTCVGCEFLFFCGWCLMFKQYTPTQVDIKTRNSKPIPCRLCTEAEVKDEFGDRQNI
jgi:hypothetical protein